MTPTPFEDTVIFTPLIVIGPELKEPDGPILFTTLPLVLIEIMLAPVVKESPAPTVKLIVPVLDAKPLADSAFSPLIDTVIAPAAVAVCKLIFAPAARAKDTAVPDTLVPEALIVCVPDGTAVCEYEITPPVVLRARPPPALYVGPKIVNDWFVFV
jgi:hypothetical protein